MLNAVVQAKSLYKNALYVFNSNRSEVNRLNLMNYKSMYKRIVKRKRRMYEQCKIKEIERLRHSKPRDFWRLFKNTKDKSSSNVSVNDFHDYFASLQNEIFTVVNEEAETFCDTHEFDNVNCRYDELDKPIVVDEVIKAVKSLKRDKAFDNDHFLNEYFIESVDILSSHLVDTFNAILESSYFSKEWSKDSACL